MSGRCSARGPGTACTWRSWSAAEQRRPARYNGGMKPVRAVSWIARGVPGVYDAARAAGLGRLDAYRVLQASAYSLGLAKLRYPRRWREENAVRHVMWQAW